MTRNTLWIGAFVALCTSALYAQDITGDWQGTLKAGTRELRVLVQIAKGDSGGWRATLFSIDQGPDRGAGAPASSLTLEGLNLKFTVDTLRATYEGKLNANGTSIAGTWTQGLPLPLELQRATPETAWKDPSPHSVQFVTVDKNVKLEVLDWGGSGRPVVLVTGLGNTAHVFDKFATKLTPAYHVYGITRRGYGVSSTPVSGYTADRLGDDVLEVIDSLKLSRPPVLVGHSIGGEELSSVGSRHPEKVAGLVYLDAGYSYAYYDRAHGDLNMDLVELQKKLEQLQPGGAPQNPKQVIQELLDSLLPAFEKDLRQMQKDLEGAPTPPASAQPAPPVPAAARAIMSGVQKYTDVRGPILAIYASPHNPGPGIANDPAARAAFEARDASTETQAKAFESGLPNARVVRLARANHYVFVSNEADVLREMNAFLGSLP